MNNKCEFVVERNIFDLHLHIVCKTHSKIVKHCAADAMREEFGTQEELESLCPTSPAWKLEYLCEKQRNDKKD